MWVAAAGGEAYFDVATPGEDQAVSREAHRVVEAARHLYHLPRAHALQHDGAGLGLLPHCGRRCPPELPVRLRTPSEERGRRGGVKRILILFSFFVVVRDEKKEGARKDAHVASPRPHDAVLFSPLRRMALLNLHRWFSSSVRVIATTQLYFQVKN